MLSSLDEEEEVVSNLAAALLMPLFLMAEAHYRTKFLDVFHVKKDGVYIYPNRGLRCVIVKY